MGKVDLVAVIKSPKEAYLTLAEKGGLTAQESSSSPSMRGATSALVHYWRSSSLGTCPNGHKIILALKPLSSQPSSRSTSFSFCSQVGFCLPALQPQCLQPFTRARPTS